MDLTRKKSINSGRERLKPALDVFFVWLETVNASSGTKLSKAVSYALNEKKYLYIFLESPYVSIDNKQQQGGECDKTFCCRKKELGVFQHTKWSKGKCLDLFSLAVTACANGINIFTGC